VNIVTGLKDYRVAEYVSKLERILDALPIGEIYLIEKQVALASKNCIIESILHSIIRFKLKKQVLSISPTDVSNHFSLLKSKYLKKRDAIVVCKQILIDREAQIKFSDINLPKNFLSSDVKMKRDDFADSFLQCLYFLDRRVTKRFYFKYKKYQHYLQKPGVDGGGGNGGNTRNNSQNTKDRKKHFGSGANRIPLGRRTTKIKIDKKEEEEREITQKMKDNFEESLRYSAKKSTKRKE
jgi:hypothetical protein